MVRYQTGGAAKPETIVRGRCEFESRGRQYCVLFLFAALETFLHGWPEPEFPLLGPPGRVGGEGGGLMGASVTRPTSCFPSSSG